MASVGLVRVGFGMEWHRTLYGAWLMLRASQLWAPVPDNDPDGARACMARFFALVRLSTGEPANPAEAARLEIDWWRVHREAQYQGTRSGASDALVESLTRLYSYLYGEPESEVRPAAVQRARAMKLSDQWVREGCPPDSPLLAHEHAALVRCYGALLAAVHHRLGTGAAADGDPLARRVAHPRLQRPALAAGPHRLPGRGVVPRENLERLGVRVPAIGAQCDRGAARRVCGELRGTDRGFDVCDVCGHGTKPGRYHQPRPVA